MHHESGWGRGRRSVRERAAAAAGFTLIEMLMVLLIAGIAMGFALMGVGKARESFKARSAVAKLKEQVTLAREMAVSQQRSVRVEFIPPNRIKLTRLEIPNGETTLRDVHLEGGMTFVRYAALDPTPDPWGGDAAIAIGDTDDDALHFRSDGALVDQANEYVNGRIFVGWGDDPASAGFVSIFGATGRVRSYRVEGTSWLH